MWIFHRRYSLLSNPTERVDILPIHALESWTFSELKTALFIRTLWYPLSHFTLNTCARCLTVKVTRPLLGDKTPVIKMSVVIYSFLIQKLIKVTFILKITERWCSNIWVINNFKAWLILEVWRYKCFTVHGYFTDIDCPGSSEATPKNMGK